MAAAYPEHESLDLFECQVCLHYMLNRQPRTLQCNHTFCQVCLQRLIHNEWNAGTYKHLIRCPTCRCITILPPGSVYKLPINFDLHKMKEHLREQDDMKTMEMFKPLCDMLSRHKSRPSATKMCTECVRKLCDDCAEHHANLEITKDHTVVTLKYREGKENKRMACLTHKQPTDYICTDCVQTLCFECTFGSKHCFHLEKITQFQDGMQILKEKANTLQDKCETFGNHATSCLGKMKGEIQKLSSIRRELTKLRTKIERTVDSVNEMLEQVDNQMEEIQSGVADFSTSEQKLLSVSKNLETLSKLEDDYYLREFEKCQVDVSSVLLEYEKDIRREYRTYQCEKGTIDLTGTIANLRDIKVSVPTCPVLKFDLNGKRNIRFTGPGQIVAVDKESAILVDQEKAIYYLDKKGSEIKSHMFDVFSIAVFNRNIFVSHSKLHQYIYTTSLDGKWKFEPKCKLPGEPLYMLVEGHEIISSLQNENVVSTFNDKGKKKAKFAAKVEGAGRLSRVIACYKEYVIVTRTRPGAIKKEAACCENKKTDEESNDDDEHDEEQENDAEIAIDVADVSVASDDEDNFDGDTVFVFSYAGTLISSFGEKGSQDGQLLYPEATAATPCGNILVADCGNHRISKFSINGMFLGHVLTEKDGIKWPTGLDYKKPHLWLTEYDHGEHCKVKLFDILID